MAGVIESIFGSPSKLSEEKHQGKDQVLADNRNLVVVSPDGQTQEIPADQAAAFSAQGFRGATPDEVRRLRLEKDFGGTKGAAIAAGSAALSGLTMGTSDTALAAAGFKEPVAASRELNPVASMVGEGAAYLAPVVGELGATRALGTLASDAVGAGVKAALPGLEKSVLGRVATSGVRMAAESLPYSAKDFISETALGDPEHAAENLWQHVGTNALMFGSLGAGGKLLGEGVKPAWEGLKKAAGKVDDVLRRYIPDAPIVEGERPVLQGPAAPEAGMAPNKDEYIREMSGSINDLRSKAKEVISEMADLKNAGKEEMLRYVPVQAAKAQAADVSARMTDALNEMRAQNDVFSKSVVDGVEKHVGAFQARISDATTPHEINAALDQLRDGLWDASGVAIHSAPSPALKDAVRQAKSMASDAKAALEDTSVWGEAGAVHGKFNSSYSRVKKADDALMSAMGEKPGKVGRLEASNRKIAQWVREGEGAEGDMRKRLFKDWVDAHHELADAGDDLAGRVGDRSGDFDRDALRALIQRSQDAADKVVGFSRESASFEAAQKAAAADAKVQAKMDADFAKAQAQEQVSEGLKDKGDLGGKLTDGAIGYALNALGHGVLGKFFLGKALLKGAVHILTNGESMAVNLSRIEAASQRAAKVIDRHVEAIASTAKEGTTAARSAYTRMDVTPAELERLRGVAGDAQAAMHQAEMVSKTVSGFAPAVGAALSAKHVQAAQYIASQAPQTMMDTPFGPQPVKASPAQWQKFMQVVHIAQDPESVLQHVQNGTLSSTHMQTMQALYPKKLEQMQMRLLNKMMGMSPTARAAIPQGRQATISAFLGIPLSTAFRPQNMQSTLRLYAARNAPSPAPKASGSLMKIGQQMQTKQQGLRASRLGIK